MASSVLLDAHAYIGENSNSTTAGDLTRNKERILASFWSASPPLPSRLYVHCPDLDSSAFSEVPRILCMAEGLILIRVAIGCRQAGCILKEECDYFIYRVDLPSLELIHNPHPAVFQDDDVGLLPRGDHYTVAALEATTSSTVFTLHLLHSHVGCWTSFAVSLVAPQKEFPVEIPKNACRLYRHWTNTVITLGGEGGTMGWVDLWRGILLCDVLSPDPTLRGVPVPLPMAQLKRNDGRGVELGCPEPYRSIAFVKGKGCLRFVDLDIRRLPHLDKETGNVSFRYEGWTITSWSNFKMTDSFEDWVMDRQPVQAKNIACNNKMFLKLEKYKLLQPATRTQDNKVAAPPKLSLQNICVSHPTLSMDVRNVMYLMAKVKFMHPEACVLAVDLEKTRLQDVAEFGTERVLGAGVICRPGSV